MEHFICHNPHMMAICQVASMNKPRKKIKVIIKKISHSRDSNTNQNKTKQNKTEKSFYIMLSYIFFLSVWSCNHKCCRYSPHVLLAWITEQGIYHQDLLEDRRQNIMFCRSPLTLNIWTENGQYWANSKSLLHLLEPVMSKVISALLFYKSCDFISPLSAL